MRCPGSVALCRDIPDRSSAAADEGTLAHQIASEVLVEKEHSHRVAKHPAAADLGAENWPPLQSYVDYVRERAHGNMLYVEVRLDLQAWLGEGGFGTADAVIYVPKSKQLQVIDLKFGQGNVVYANAKGEGDTMTLNPQLGIYALGAHRFFEFLDIDDIEVHIVQPRREHVSVAAATPAQLIRFAADIFDGVEQVKRNPSTYVPGEAQCRWCPARATCDARARWHLDSFAREVALLQPAEVGKMLAQVGDMRQWCTDIEEHAMQQLTATPGSIPGWKLVEGRSVRTWTDNAAHVLINKCGIDPYERKLMGIGAIEKLLGKDQSKEVMPIITVKGKGKPTLAPEADPREAINTGPAFDVEP